MSFEDIRKQLRRLSTEEPTAQKTVIPTDDGSIQVGEGFEEQQVSDLTYQKDGFSNPIKTSVLVAEEEHTFANLEISDSLLIKHRKELAELVKSVL